MYIDINTLFTFEVSKSDDQSILAAIVRLHILRVKKPCNTGIIMSPTELKMQPTIYLEQFPMLTWIFVF
jgi:hypothetical protein